MAIFKYEDLHQGRDLRPVFEEKNENKNTIHMEVPSDNSFIEIIPEKSTISNKEHEVDYSVNDKVENENNSEQHELHEHDSEHELHEHELHEHELHEHELHEHELHEHELHEHELHEHELHEHEHEHSHYESGLKNLHKCNHNHNHEDLNAPVLDNNKFKEEDIHPYLAIFCTTISALAATVGGVIIELGENGFFEANCYMFLGMILFLLITALIPEPEAINFINIDDKTETKEETDSTITEDSHENEDKNNSTKKEDSKEKRLNMRMITTGLFTVIGISLHNLPEGLVVYNATVVGVCSLQSPTSLTLAAWIPYISQCMGRGLAVAFAIAMHNIPEGMAVALPIYYATNSKWEAFKWCFVSSLCEPLGAVIFGLFFQNYITHYVMAALNAVVAGIMILLCIIELIPACLENISPRAATVSNLIGQAFMFLTLYGLIQAGAH
ncbi:hypothetical protein WA158_004663 [Blastocystis sp. Blastoise]